MCQQFRTELQYMGNTTYIKNKRVCMKPLKARHEAIQKLKLPKAVKDSNSFEGVVHYLSMFCTNLEKLLKPMI